MGIKDCNAPLSDNVNRILREKGLKQGAVAQRAGFSKQQFSDMLNGRKIIKPCDAIAIADTLGVTMNELYGVETSEEVR